MLRRSRLQDTVPKIEDERPLACRAKDAFDLSRHPLAPSDKHLRIKVALDAPP